MENVCATCGAPLKPGVRFCARCGASLPAQGSPLPETPLVRSAATAGPAVRSVLVHLGETFGQRRTAATVGVAFAVILVAVLILLVWTRRPASPAGGQAATTPAERQPSAATEGEMQSLVDMANQYESLERQADTTNRQIAVLLSRYQRRGEKLPPNFGANLTDEQRVLLARRIQEERAGPRDLLQDILDRDKQVRSLRMRIAELGNRLPTNVTANEGDRHDRIAMDFLLKKGVPAATAYQLVSTINLEENLLPGFRVWTYYANGQFGTWVTQGTATISPQEHRQRLQQVLRDERDQAVKNAAVLQTRVDELDAQRRSAEEKVAAASAETGAALELAEKLQKAQNSIRYAIGSKNQLTSAGAIKKNLEPLSFDAVAMQVLDLNEGEIIAIDGTAYGLKRIKKLTVVPQMFKAGADYKVVIDGATAQVQLLNHDKFKTSRVFIVLE